MIQPLKTLFFALQAILGKLGKLGKLAALVIIFSATNSFAHGEGHQEESTSSQKKAHLVYKEKNLHLHVEFAKEPEVGTEMQITVQARDPKTHQVKAINDQLEVVLWMPSMGHGSAPTVVSPSRDENGNLIPGTFTVKSVYFVMAGDWEVYMSLIDGSGNKVSKKFEIHLIDQEENINPQGAQHGVHH